ncbi:hypothetical protein CAN33_0015790 [Aspergillus niger]|uniref:Uncharacterized protein n=1 Tax=Aspergillus niger TaxID=5061 RepID=A0A505I7V4_ASPNG|nr:hypothetical protein CAN33_0015790 [Aspergillus niger]
MEEDPSTVYRRGRAIYISPLTQASSLELPQLSFLTFPSIKPNISANTNDDDPLLFHIHSEPNDPSNHYTSHAFLFELTGMIFEIYCRRYSSLSPIGRLGEEFWLGDWSLYVKNTDDTPAQRLRKKELREELANLKSLDRQHKQVLQEKEEKWALQQKALVDIIQELDEKMAVDVALVKKLVTDVDVSIKKAVKELEGLV